MFSQYQSIKDLERFRRQFGVEQPVDLASMMSGRAMSPNGYLGVGVRNGLFALYLAVDSPATNMGSCGSSAAS